MSKKIRNYFSKNVEHNSVIHLIAGIGVGILITYPFVGSHPVRWGLSLVALGVLGHIYPLIIKKR